jgi:hypothetical protein
MNPTDWTEACVGQVSYRLSTESAACLMPAAAKERKHFFFEKKKQKTFIC